MRYQFVIVSFVKINVTRILKFKNFSFKPIWVPYENVKQLKKRLIQMPKKNNTFEPFPSFHTHSHIHPCMYGSIHVRVLVYKIDELRNSWFLVVTRVKTYK